jgi:hypothetical protein
MIILCVKLLLRQLAGSRLLWKQQPRVGISLTVACNRDWGGIAKTSVDAGASKVAHYGGDIESAELDSCIGN